MTAYEILSVIVHTSILTDEFAEEAAQAGWRARQAALAVGHYLVFLDAEVRYVEERPNGQLLEIRFDPTQTGEAHRIIVRELPPNAHELLFESLASVVDPDAIARTIDPNQPSRAAIAAARQAIIRARSLLANQESFIPVMALCRCCGTQSGPATGHS